MAVEPLVKLGPKHSFAYGRVDPREAGRRGRIASGAARMQKPAKEEQRLEERVVELRNGAAVYAVLRDRRERERRREEELWRRDKELCDMDQLLLNVREQVNEVIAERERLDAELAEREARLEQC